MSFTNPFAQQLGSDDSASIEYFSGNPNPQTLEQPELVMVFKNLLRKDQTTREKACATLLMMIPGIEIDDSLHLAWIQVYAKLCFDISTVVRTQSHEILGLIYHKLGKKCTKYLKDTLPCLLCGIYDPVKAVANSATQAFELLFNTEERRQLVIKKFNAELEAFCENVILNQSPQTLSDERYISKEESTLKYDRVLKQVIDVINNILLKQEIPLKLLDSSKFWKLMAASNSMVARSTLNLATAAIKQVEDPKKVFKQIIKAMNQASPAAAVELIRALLTYTKHENYFDSASQTALDTYIKHAGTFSQPFWPLFYNLALTIGVTKPLVQAMAGLASKAVGATQTDIWGCFLSLCARSNVKEYNEIATKALIQRSERDMSDPLIKAIASRFQKITGVESIVESSITNFRFALVLAATGNWTSQLSAAASQFTLAQVAQLVNYDPNLTLDINLNDDKDQDLKSLLQIATTSKTVDSQAIASHVLEKNPDLILAFSDALAQKGVELDLGSKLNLTDASTLKKAVAAHGGLVDDQSAKNYVWSLATSALEGSSESWSHLSDLASSDPAFIQQTLGKTELGSKLLNELYVNQKSELTPLFNTLNLGDSSDSLIEQLLVGDVSNLEVLIDRAVNLKSNDTEKLLLVGKQWLPDNLWPDLSVSDMYPVQYSLSDPADAASIDRVLKIGVYLVTLIHRLKLDAPQPVLANIAIVSSFCTGYHYSSTSVNKHIAEALKLEAESLVEKADTYVLLDIVATSNSSSAYLAAQTIYPRLQNGSNNELCVKYRKQLGSPSVISALLAQLSAGVGLHWYDRTQRQEYEKQASDVAAFCCIDSGVDTEKFKEMCLELCESADEPLLQEVLIRLDRIDGDGLEVSEEVIERALEYGQPTSQKLVLPLAADFEREVVRAASKLKDTGSLANNELVAAFLAHCKSFLHEDIGINFKKSSSSPQIAWVLYCCKRGRTVAKYRDQLEKSEFEDTKIDIQMESYPDWLLYLDLIEEYTRASQSTGRKSAATTTVFAEYEGINTEILDFIGHALQDGTLDSLSPSVQFEDLDTVVGDSNASIVTLLYRMCTLLGSSVRQWYRSNNDRSLQLAIDQCLRNYIVPATMRSLQKRVQHLRQDGTLEATAISERGREFRAQIEIDETVAQIVITLDPLFPVKNANVQLIGLDGVPEHKKRGWIIEAEYTVQNGSIIDAMRTLILKVNNFLEGIEPCAICYSVMEGKNIPNKTCTTCKNKYHTECLYKWFASNKGEKNCPMCRSKM